MRFWSVISIVHLRYYLGLDWPVNFVLGVPFIGFGASAMEMKLNCFAFFFLLFALIFFLLKWLKKKYEDDLPG